MELSALLIEVAEIIGIIAFSVSGAMTAISKGLDLFGVTFIGIVTALGGGVIRDLLLGITPPTMFTNMRYVIIALVSAILVFIIIRLRGSYTERARRVSNAMMTIFDAIGLGVFTVVGISVAINAGHSHNSFLAISVGVITGTGGGVLRDLLSGTVPSILCKHVYAVASMFGGIVYFFMFLYTGEGTLSMFTGIFIVIVLRILAAKFRWNLPKAAK